MTEDKAYSPFLQGRPIDAQTVIYRLEEAGMNLLALPSRTGGSSSCWPPIVREAVEAYGYNPVGNRITPSSVDIDRMDEALGWIALIPLTRGFPGSGEMWSRGGGALLRRIVSARALVSPRTERHIWSWRRLGKRLGSSHEAIRGWHAIGIDTIVAVLQERG